MIEVLNITKKYGNTEVVSSVSFAFKIGQVYSIIGSSGSGKSTFLKCIAGLEKLDAGDIKYGNITKQKIGFIFQHFNLFANMTVLENITYAPQKVLKITKQDAINEARRFLKKVTRAQVVAYRSGCKAKKITRSYGTAARSRPPPAWRTPGRAWPR